MVNKDKVEAAVKLLLEGMGEDVNREGLKETPARVARMYEEPFVGFSNPASILRSVDFPEPEVPTIAQNSP